MKIIAIVLLAAIMAAGVAQLHSGGNVPGDLDALKYRLNNVSDRLGPELVHVKTAEYQLYQTRGNVSATALRDDRTLADGAIADAAGYDDEIAAVERGLEKVQARYDPRDYSRLNGTIAEGKMAVLKDDIARQRNDSTELRLSAGHIKSMT